MNFYDQIARYYDAENLQFTDDLSFYEGLVGEYGAPLMDVGCGTGRVLLHLAQAGIPCVGVDNSVEMLALARRKLEAQPHLAAQVTLVEADILNYQDEQRYPLVTLPYNGLMHFREQAQQLQLLRRLEALLADNGALVLDLPNAGDAYASEQHPGIVLERSFSAPQTGNLVMQQSVSEINYAEQLLQVTWIYDEILPDGLLKRTVAPLTLRYVFAAELRLLLQLAGFGRVNFYGDYDYSPFVDGSPRMIAVAAR